MYGLIGRLVSPEAVIYYRSKASVLGNIYCGDGRTQNHLYDPKVLVDSEQCDDGNNIGGDGCSSICQVEPVRLYDHCSMLFMFLTIDPS